MRRPRGSRLRQPAASLGLLVLLLTYVTSFWGRAGFLLPPPLDNWHHVFFRGLTRWSEGAQEVLRTGENLAVFAGIEAYVLGLIVPATLLALLWRRSLLDLGFRWPNAIGWRWSVVGVAAAAPVGLWMTALVPPSGGDLAYAVRLLVMIPEHFLIFGVGIALLLPGRRLSYPPLPPASLLAVLGSAALFVVVHVGARPAELAFSAPMGGFCAYVTWRTASIWPALLTHWSLNLAPLGLRSLFP